MKYIKEFKLDALNLLQVGKSISDISKRLDISADTLGTWGRGYQLHGDKAFQRLAIRLPKNEQHDELRRLKKRVTELKMECDI